MAKKLIEIINGQAVDSRYQMAEPVNFQLEEGEQMAIFGPNGAGKTRLVEMITGRYRLRNGGIINYDFSDSEHKYVSDNIRYISFKDSYGIADAGYYYQQRWNQMEIDPEFTPTTGSVLEEYRNGSSSDGRLDELVDSFGLRGCLDKYVITLSSGELRKLQLIKYLITAPKVLIIDNPFLGLDIATRQQLSDLLHSLGKEGLSVILVVSRRDEIPSFIDSIVEVNSLKVSPKKTAVRDDMRKAPTYSDREDGAKAQSSDNREDGAKAQSSDNEKDGTKPQSESEDVLKFNKVSIRYGGRTILSELDWRVRQGEHWILTGENGCGKSTLLSLVCADNPQAYACDIELFGRKRGSGESIWDIKKRIGYVSPEMHRAYSRDMPCELIVASGLYDRAGLYFRPSEEDMSTTKYWMEEFGIAQLEGRSFLQVSSGEQRLCLLARAFVKNSPLLILDEPMHGLDDYHKEWVRRFLNAWFTEHPEKTLVMVTHYDSEMPSCIDHRLTLTRH